MDVDQRPDHKMIEELRQSHEVIISFEEDGRQEKSVKIIDLLISLALFETFESTYYC
jgi:hypothetical protein